MFADRVDAGRRLGAVLKQAQRPGEQVVVVGLPRGGVMVAWEVARALQAPLDVVVVRKLGVPFQPELAMGAIGERDVRVIEDQVVHAAGVSQDEILAVEARERRILEDRLTRFRRGRVPVAVEDRTVVVVDDGIATGSTARAACQVVRAQGASRVVLGVPVAPPGTELRVKDVADEFVAVSEPEAFYAIGLWYEDFSQVSDDAVVHLLDRARILTVGNAAEVLGDEVLVQTGSVQLPGRLTIPDDSEQVVLFAHGTGSSRNSPRNQAVAEVLQEAGLGTLLFDLLTENEAADREKVFDVELLAQRLSGAEEWVHRTCTSVQRVGYFGASTGAAAALRAASAKEPQVFAVVSRGGRPDLAGASLKQVSAPTLLIVGGRDEVVLDLNRQALAEMECERELVVVPGATHLFEEPGALEEVSRRAAAWFTSYAFPGR